MVFRLTTLLVLCVAFAGGALAVEFPDTRVQFAQSESEPEPLPEPKIDIKPPWGLWANRAPYPYYDGPFGIDTSDDPILAARRGIYETSAVNRGAGWKNRAAEAARKAGAS